MVDYAMPTDSHELQVEEELGTRFRVTAFLGGGSFGEVYRMRDLRLDLDVAVKIMRAAERSSPEARASFIAEARKQARLRHVPQVVGIYETGELDYHDGPFPYIVMELLEGGSLRDRIKQEQPMPLAEACFFGVEIALALTAAGEEHLIHRDIKPANVLLDTHGHAKLSDFGLAKVLEQSQGMTSHLAGTASYMAPEQFRGKDISPKADIYALGCTLFHLLAGAPPYSGAMEQMMYAHLVQPAPSLRDQRPDAPEALDELLSRMMAKSPAQRPTSVDVAEELLQLAQTQPAPTRAMAEVFRPTAPAPRSYDPEPPSSPALPAASYPRYCTPGTQPRLESISVSLDVRQSRRFWGWVITVLSVVLLAAVALNVYPLLAKPPASAARNPPAPTENATASGDTTFTQGHAPAFTPPASVPGAPSNTDTPPAAHPASPAVPDHAGNKAVPAAPGKPASADDSAKNSPAPEKPSTPAAPPPAIAYKSSLNPADGAEMILIPAGNFLLGSVGEYAPAEEKPQRMIYLDDYCIYKNDVTVAQYRKFCAANGRKMPGLPSASQDDHPMVNVSWYDAKAYADWAGASLPTEAQWEKAARGDDGRRFPWGNDWDARKCCNGAVNRVVGGTMPVGSYPAGASPYGVLDMAGNVWQWCADWSDGNYYQHAPERNPTGPETGTMRILRGGSWSYPSAEYFRAAQRYWFFPTGGGPDFGFRCVKSAP